MLKEFEKELIYRIDRSSKEVKAYSYLGEFENIKEFEKCIKFAPIILIDFVGESYINPATKEANYKIYFVNSTANKSEEHRQICKFTLLDLIEKMDALFLDTNFTGGFNLELKNLTKIYENVSDYGYLSIYARDVKVNLRDLDKSLNEFDFKEML